MIFWARRHPILALWLVALAASTAVRFLAPSSDRGGRAPRALEVRAVDGDRLLDRPVRLAYAEYGGDGDAAGDRPVVVLLHGSPGWHQDLTALGERLGGEDRAIVPDLPGFGSSTRDVPDYSIRAHARYVLELLDGLGIRRAHVVGFSMGGGVAIELADIAPERVASLTLLSGIGVQEHELLGEYHLNHALHGLQLASIQIARAVLPHFGALDGWLVPYARNFFDTDQRPLRGILERLDTPALILHGDRDGLVPPAAALEHHRLLPQSRLEMSAAGHFLLFTQVDEVAASIRGFVADVEKGRAPSRAQALGATTPSDATASTVVAPASGIALAILMTLLAASTLVSEDLTCIAAGLLVAHGRIGFVAAAVACFAGIYVGDLLLFLAGRRLGRRALSRWPLTRIVSPAALERSSAWLERNGATVIALSRFTPGTRLPTYVAAGVLETRALAFALYFFVAAALWTPALVALAMVAGDGARAWLAESGGSGLAAASVIGVALVIALRLGLPLATWRGRRLAIGRWRRFRRWEFWPLGVFYVPIAARIAWLAIRHRSLTLPTAANPAIPGGGFAGESKIDILRGLAATPSEHALATELVPANLAIDDRVARVRAFMLREGLAWPIVLKPDVGERGFGVSFPRSDDELRAHLARATVDLLAQEYAPGAEFGIFYHRLPDEAHGRICSITEKVFPVVRGDGRRTLEELILADERAVCMARTHLARFASRLDEVPAACETISLVEVGTHSRGAVFLDGRRLRTPELEAAIDHLSRGYAGFYFGRYDVRTADAASLAAGHFRVVELNGLTAEATHIYDPASSLFDAYRVLFEQWRIAFEIGRRNRERGARPASLRELARLVWRARRRRTP